jgi:hypothetical protein
VPDRARHCRQGTTDVPPISLPRQPRPGGRRHPELSEFGGAFFRLPHKAPPIPACGLVAECAGILGVGEAEQARQSDGDARRCRKALENRMNVGYRRPSLLRRRRRRLILIAEIGLR